MSDPATIDPQLHALVGATLHGRYLVERAIAFDEFGARFAARQLQPERAVGLRVLAPGLDTREFERDSGSFTQLEHPNCLRTLAVSKTETGLAYLVSDPLEGSPWSQASKSWSLKESLDAGRQLFDLLAHAHDRGITHGALATKLVCARTEPEGPRLLIADFGLTKFRAAAPSAGTQVYGSTAQGKGADILAAAELLRDALGNEVPTAVSSTIVKVIAAARGSKPPAAAAVREQLRELATTLGEGEGDDKGDARRSRKESSPTMPSLQEQTSAQAPSPTTGEIKLPELEPGVVVAERFRLEAPLGHGGMGVVWKATHLALRSPVAIKLLFPTQIDPDEARARFLREARASAALRSSHIVQVFDYGVHEGMPYLVMELLEGTTLEDRLEQGPLGFDATIEIMRDVCAGMSRAHENDVIHRDLKPANIFWVKGAGNERDRAKVLDFGIAKFLGNSADFKLAETQTGALLGTPYYMSPEQLQETKSVDHRADLWALGIITFQCLTGERPFDSRSLVDLCIAITTKDAPAPEKLASLPAGVDTWMRKALAREPDQRFATAEELFTALSEISSQPNKALKRVLQPGPRRNTQAEIDFGPNVGPALSLQMPAVGGGKPAPRVPGSRAPSPGVARERRYWPFVLIALGLAVLFGGYYLIQSDSTSTELAGADTEANADPNAADPAAKQLPPEEKEPPTGFGDSCSEASDCGWEDPCAPTRCVATSTDTAAPGCDTPAPTPGECSCVEEHCVLHPNEPPSDPPSCEGALCGLDQATGSCVAGTMTEANEHLVVGPACLCDDSTRRCDLRWIEPIRCKSSKDCWVSDTLPFFPIERAKALRGKEFMPCRDGEFAPTCRSGECSLISYNCD